MRLMRTPTILVALAWVAFLAAGCGTRTDRPETHPVSGRVLESGKPAAGARVQLSAVGDPRLAKLCPHAEVGADGTFRLTTFTTGDGAPAGKYALTLSWPLPPRPGKEQEGPDRFKGRYADPRRPLRQVQVVAGANVLDPIQLPR
jgi:hypothetical protein